MININSKVVIVGAIWIGLGSLVNRTLGMETLQLYVICSLIFLFIRYGTGNNKRRPGEASPYAFLNPKDEDLENEVVPFVSVERLKKVLGNSSNHQQDEEQTTIPDENSVEGAQLRRMISRQSDTKSAIALVEQMRNASKDELPDLKSKCVCGSGRFFGKCCAELWVYLSKQKKLS